MAQPAMTWNGAVFGTEIGFGTKSTRSRPDYRNHERETRPWRHLREGVRYL